MQATLDSAPDPQRLAKTEQEVFVMGNDHVEDMQGDELASKLKSSIVFKSANDIKHAELKLAREDMAWWQDAKFGMFIHWGLYAIPARGEWVMHNGQIPAGEYAKLADPIVSQKFDRF